MKTSTRTSFALNSRTQTIKKSIRQHRLPLCEATNLARYRDRHQARHGARAVSAGTRNLQVATFACPSCRGFHLEKMFMRLSKIAGPVSVPNEELTAPSVEGKRRYVLFDIENPTAGAKATSEELAAFWAKLKETTLGLTPSDHVVIGAARRVVRKYRSVFFGANVKWVVGANAPDGADRALLAAIDLRRVARDYDELVIISGDHAFSELAHRAKTFGLSVHVVTAEQSDQNPMLSRKLAATADIHTLVPIDLHTRAQRPVIRMGSGAGLDRTRVPFGVAAA